MRIVDKSKNPEDVARFKCQRNLVVNKNMKAKESLFSETDPIRSPKGFWDTCKPLLSSKTKFTDERMQLIKDGSIISNNLDIAEIFNEHYHCC